MMFRFRLVIIGLLFSVGLKASMLLIPMDAKQKNHLKAYGIAFWSLEKENTVDWLLNYRGGSFVISYQKSIEDELIIRGVSYELIADAQYGFCLLYTSPSPRDRTRSRMPSSA